MEPRRAARRGLKHGRTCLKSRTTPPERYCWGQLNTDDTAKAEALAAAALRRRSARRPGFPPTVIEGTGEFAVLADPQGATFALYRA